MRERVSRRLAAIGLRLVLGAAATVAMAWAGGGATARAADPSVLVASRYSGSDLTGGQSAWPPRATTKPSATPPLWPASRDESKTWLPLPLLADEPAEPQVRVQSAQGADQDTPGAGGFISEVRLGALVHDAALVTGRRERGADVTAEVLFTSPEFLDIIASPRPHLGLAVNTAGDTSQLFAGLTWDWNFAGSLFVEGTLGLAVHDGELTASAGHKGLGCRVLFRESVALGARFLARHNISLVFAHISNADLCGQNEGLDTIGVRYGYVF